MVLWSVGGRSRFSVFFLFKFVSPGEKKSGELTQVAVVVAVVVAVTVVVAATVAVWQLWWQWSWK
jgi:hypothetical protein